MNDENAVTDACEEYASHFPDYLEEKLGVDAQDIETIKVASKIVPNSIVYGAFMTITRRDGLEAAIEWFTGVLNELTAAFEKGLPEIGLDAKVKVSHCIIRHDGDAPRDWGRDFWR